MALSDSGKDTEKLELLGSLVPARVIRHHLQNAGKEHQLVPFSEQYEAAVLFADISGFSGLAEKLAKDLNCDANAAEDLSSYIGKSLELMVEAVCSKGGDVIKFAGDAILAVFPADKFNNNIEVATISCVQVALDLRRLELRAGGVELSVHCGVGAGAVTSFHVGGMFSRWEYVITGDPVEQIGSAEPEAQAGEVVIAKRAYESIAVHCIGNALPSGNFKVDKLRDHIELMNHQLIFSDLKALVDKPEELLRMETALRSYVPRPVLQAIDARQSLWFSELRLCSTLFCRLKGLNFESPSSLDLIQQAVLAVQEQLYTYEGTLCRFIVDDKGAGLLMAFGLPPFMHENDPVRAIKAAMSIHEAVKFLGDQTQDPLCASIGVTSGRVFCGTSGGSIRCEYTLHGTVVNLAARYMVAAKDGVFCGENTYKEAKQYIVFSEPKKIKVKGKDSEVNVYRPIAMRDIEGFDPSENLKPMVGRQSECRAIEASINNIVVDGSAHEAVMICGDAGMGKTAMLNFARKMAYDVRLSLVVGEGLDTEASTALFVFKSIMSQLTQRFYEKVVCFRFKAWLQFDIRQHEGIALPVVASKLVSTRMSAEFFRAIETLANKKDESATEQDTPLGAMVEMGLVDQIMDNRKRQPPSSSLRRSKSREPPPFSFLSNELKINIVKEMIPFNMQEMVPLLSGIVPGIEAEDNDVTAKMKKELRSENRILLVKEMFIKVVQELENVSLLREAVSREFHSASKAISKMGEGSSDITGASGSNKVSDSSTAITKGGRLFGRRNRQHHAGAASVQNMKENDDSSGKKSSNHDMSKEERGNSAQSNSWHGSIVDTTPNDSQALENISEQGELQSKAPAPMIERRNFKRVLSYRMRVGSKRFQVTCDRLVITIDNMQWVDPLSCRLLQMIAKEVKPIVLILATRAPDVMDAYPIEEMEVLTLEKFSREEVREEMCTVLGVKDVPDKAVSAVMEKSGGHPLFSEELTKLMLAEKMLEIQNEACRLSKKAQEGSFGLPDTISALITSKLDRLIPSQQLLLKVASVIGIDFEKAELVAILPRTGSSKQEDFEREIQRDMEALVQENLLVRDSNGLSAFRFANAMLRETAYNLLLYQKRKDLHRNLAQHYERQSDTYSSSVNFLLATNYYFAEVNDKAVYYSQLAGDEALETHAMQQVLICFSRLIDLDDRDPDVTCEIPLVEKAGWCRKLGEALLHLGKPVDAEEYFQAALEQTGLRRTEIIGATSSCFAFLSRSRKTLHLVKDLTVFHEMKCAKLTALMLEISNTFELLGRINNNRNSNAALEYRLNALELSRAAHELLQEGGQDTESTLMQLASACLARSYAHAAVFHGTIGTSAAREIAQQYIKTASSHVESVNDSETQALVHFKNAELSAMIGQLKDSLDQVRKASWVCKFLHFERLRRECTFLNVSVLTFCGKLGKAKQILVEIVQSMPKAAPDYEMLALAARAAILVGDFEFTESCLERIARVDTGAFRLNHVQASKLLMKNCLPDTMVALSLLLTRKYCKNDLAIQAAIHGTETLGLRDLEDLPLVKFHSVAFLITAFAEAMDGISLLKRSKQGRKSHRASFSQVIPFDDFGITETSHVIRKNAVKHLNIVMRILNVFSKVYTPCVPHFKHCYGLYRKILKGTVTKAERNLFTEAVASAKTESMPYVQAIALLQLANNDQAFLEQARFALMECLDNKLASKAAALKKNEPEHKIGKNGETGKQNTASDAPYELRLVRAIKPFVHKVS